MNYIIHVQTPIGFDITLYCILPIMLIHFCLVDLRCNMCRCTFTQGPTFEMIDWKLFSESQPAIVDGLSDGLFQKRMQQRKATGQVDDI